MLRIFLFSSVMFSMNGIGTRFPSPSAWVTFSYAVRRKLARSSLRQDLDKPVKKPRTTTTVRKKKPLLLIEDFSPKTVCNVLLTCGNGDVGQRGNGEESSSDRCSKPKRIKTLSPPIENGSGFLQIAAGSFHTVVLTSDHKVYTCGCNDECALGRDCFDDDGSTQRIDDQDFMLRPINFAIDLVQQHGNPIQISAGDSHTALLTNSGSVFLWGTFRDKQGALGLSVKHDSSSARVGQVIDKSASPLLISSFRERTIVKICSGFNHLALLASDGSIYSAGAGDVGQLGRLAPQFRDSSSSFRAIARMLTPFPVSPEVRHRIYFNDMWCAGYCCFAKSQDDIIFVWGLNNYHQLGYVPNDFEQPSVYYPIQSEQFKSAIKWTDFTGDHHVVAIDDQNNVYAIGRGDDSRLGNGSDNNQQMLVQLKDFDGTVAGVAAGNNYSYMWNKEGLAFSWGYDLEGETGQGLDDSEAIEAPRPLNAKSLKTVAVMQIAAGGQHVVFMGKEKDTNEKI